MGTVVDLGAYLDKSVKESFSRMRGLSYACGLLGVKHPSCGEALSEARQRWLKLHQRQHAHQKLIGKAGVTA